MGIFSQLTATNFASAGVCASGAIIFSTPLLLLFSPLCDGLSVFGGENVCWVACTQVPFYVGGDFRCWHFRYVKRIIVRLSPFSISSFFREIALGEMRNIDRRPLFSYLPLHIRPLLPHLGGRFWSFPTLPLFQRAKRSSTLGQRWWRRHRFQLFS